MHRTLIFYILTKNEKMIKFTLLLVLFLTYGITNAQESQKGLLWKISGNGLTKPSYIYGNMHVSSKIAFRLGEEFFEAISSVDKIALESNPIIWLDEIMGSKLAENYIGDFDIQRQKESGFYKKDFRLVIPDNGQYANALSSDHYFMNWLLYRENKSNSDFEEETFLDMFIYQSGAKNNKEVLSLEKFKENTSFVQKASLPDIEDRNPSPWFVKLTKEQSYGDLMEEAYRKQNLSLIDSLQKEVSSKNSMYWMIEKRNEKMAFQVDSIIKSGTSLFSGVGAAHLPGEKGILQLLKDLGYTVTPMPVTFSDKARALREEFDNKKIPLKNFTTFNSDLFSVEVPVNLYETPYSETQRQWFGPELTNGSHFTIKQISTLGYFKNISQTQFSMKVDSLLFENIPGKIESKTKISDTFYSGFDIINKLKNGDYQRYRIYNTPINILIFKMGGKDDYVKLYGNRFFESIKLKNPLGEWETTSTIHHDFSISMPKYHSINYNTMISSLYGHPIIEGWDSKDSTYYVVQRRSLYDFTFLEEDDFELKRIAEYFFINMEMNSVKAVILNNQDFPASFAQGFTKDSSLMGVKVIINGPYYYLLASISKSKIVSHKFFDSFKIELPEYVFKSDVKTDSTTLLSVTSNYISPTPFEYTKKTASYKKRNKNKTKDDSFKEDINTEVFYSENYDQVRVRMKKFHIYEYYENLDTLWNKVILEATYNKQNSYSSYNSLIEEYNYPYATLIIRNKKTTTERGLPVLYLDLTDTSTSRTYINKYILKHGLLQQITAVTDSSGKKSAFITNFFTNASPLDTIAGRSVFEDKASLYFQSLLGNDSLMKDFAIQSTYKIKFKAKDIDTIKLILDNFKFPAKNIHARKQLISQLLDINEFNNFDYIRKLYKNAGDTSMYQIEILNSLAAKGTKQSIALYLELLDFDIPISEDNYSNNDLFSPFRYNLENKKYKRDVFPTLLSYTFIDKYRNAIIGALASQVDSNFINPVSYKKNVNQLLREAKIILKEEISYEQSQQATGSNTRRYSSYSKSYEYKTNDLLVDYATILIPFANNKNVNDFLTKFYQLKNYSVRNEVFCRMDKSGIKIDTSIWNDLASDAINVASLYKTMDTWDLLNYFPKKYINQQIIAKALLFENGFNFEEDSLVFLLKKYVNDGKDSGYVYFFKTKEKMDDDWEINYIGFQPLDTTKINFRRDISRKGSQLSKSIPEEDTINEIINIISLRYHPHADGKDDRFGYGYYY